ncbi:MAG: hypothetical protein ACOCZL_00380 [Bacteroidota bacterium]
MYTKPSAILKNFRLPGCSFNLSPVGTGHIHKTFKITCENSSAFILQKLNTFVFKNPEELMKNALRISRHLEKKNRETGSVWRIISFIPTLKGNYLYQDPDGKYWRAINYIPHLPLNEFDQNIYFRGGRSLWEFYTNDG